MARDVTAEPPLVAALDHVLVVKGGLVGRLPAASLTPALVAGLEAALAGKAAVAHEHAADDIIDTGSKVAMTTAERAKLASFVSYWLTRLASAPSATIQTLLAAVDADAAQDALGAGAGGKAVLAAASAAAARAALGLDAVYEQGLQGAYTNRIINGAMNIDQRNVGAAVLVDDNGFYLLDRWRVAANGAAGNGTLTVQQVANPGGYALKITVTTVRTGPAAGDAFDILQWIEGDDIADLRLGTANAQAFTVSFKVQASLTGTYVLSVGNGAADRCYPVAFTIDQANTEESKAITIPGDTAGNWAAVGNKRDVCPLRPRLRVDLRDRRPRRLAGRQ